MLLYCVVPRVYSPWSGTVAGQTIYPDNPQRHVGKIVVLSLRYDRLQVKRIVAMGRVDRRDLEQGLLGYHRSRRLASPTQQGSRVWFEQ